ncbi:MAG: FAD binding domain-containing protein [Actinomycetota bacterium]|nr:FAD binding domain-containing protein [Actinomycetota bacterium]
MITQYHRPLTLDEAIALTARPDVVIIAGGTSVNSDPGRSPVTAVDLQALDLAGIDTDGESIRIGATTLLQDLVDSALVPAVLRDLARREAPNTIRNAATVGGTIGAVDPESELLAGLLAFGATVTLAHAGSTTEHTLDEILDDSTLLNGGIMTSVSIPSNGLAAADRTGRTPMDRPIVMAVAHRSHGGEVRVAMTGVSTRPVVVDPEQIDALDPPSDFRGSSGYRKSLALVLAGRVFATVTGGEPT